jgi:hypothetical protein
VQAHPSPRAIFDHNHLGVLPFFLSPPVIWGDPSVIVAPADFNVR